MSQNEALFLSGSVLFCYNQYKYTQIATYNNVSSRLQIVSRGIHNKCYIVCYVSEW